MQYQSENTTNILRAISKARQEFKTIEKSKENSFFKDKSGKAHKYSTLTDINNGINEALVNNDLFINYQIRIIEKKDAGHDTFANGLTTTITHLTTNEFIASHGLLGYFTKSQDLGSAITYLRRYHIQSMLNLEGDFEDDGNLSSGKVENKKTLPKDQTIINEDNIQNKEIF